MADSRTFIIHGVFEHLSGIREYLNDGVCGILLYLTQPEAEARKSSACPPQFADRLFTFDSLTRLTNDVIDERDWELYDRCLRVILGDSRVHYLAMRTYFDSALNSTVVIEKIVANTLRIRRATRPDRLVSSSTPHSVEAWVFARCLEEAGIPVFILERTPINNRAWIYRGLDTQEVVQRSNGENKADLSSYTRSQVRAQIESKAGARDDKGYYVSRMDLSSIPGADSSEWWSWRRELPLLFAGRLISLPIRVASIYLKRRLYRSYRRLAITELPKGPFVIFFMHYQPERSSLPEGLFYTQQWIALRQLALTMPEGWTLLVREHPSMWLLPLDVTVRTPDYFEQIAKLPNTKICSMEFDTFELIDRSAVVSTLTGSVGFQALLRGRPVIVFGLPAYKGHPACFVTRNMRELADAFAVICRGVEDQLSPPVLEKYLTWVERNSIVADENEEDWLAARLKNFREIYRELLSGRLAL